MTYYPSQQILERYADVLINFALNSGKGVKKGEVVRITATESGKPLYLQLRKAVLKAGAHPMGNFLPDDDAIIMPTRDFYNLASEEQLNFFPKKYIKGLVEQIDHTVSVISTHNKHVLQGIDPKKIMTVSKAMKPFTDWLFDKENKGKFTWTVGLFGTPEMAKEAELDLEQYWKQIIDGCFLNDPNPIAKWRQVSNNIEKIRTKLNQLKIDRVHVLGIDVDLWLTIGKKRLWNGGSGRNIPSFEIFTSPDWRETQGWIKFSQPLYIFGNLIKNVELEFKNGRVVKSKASKNENVLKEMIAQKNADKVGEFSLTDGRFSHITKFMAETLYDENVGGPQGNTHIALGRSYHDCFDGDPSKLNKNEWAKLGYNNSAIHTDIVSTTNRKVTAYLANGVEKIIYKDGVFSV
ncbi:thermophilic metalloprotease (M29) superfamily [Candidatus Beckwithbacteria bacterium CG23_combo_of_CG06-09_8_20_14_all_34_8]|uniref:Thermophilic metalloprotease (M29) superfamily n=1 Tax=Candidatus Beckwithbacteria bacterium CG23_combo_of_CG06-09_8_20_14_all_34_8 TaxID=1974497 RepID=A0A2H0B7I3_9BACT|nr:MAG: thermophilic metalloprotease (M29) superfamily [Candidatus Beckwithbacteria bacterium CG23_combo_of_CG06-09_8_20_14_all_34_8]